MSDDVRDPGCPVETVNDSGYYLCARLIGHGGDHDWQPRKAAEAGHG